MTIAVKIESIMIVLCDITYISEKECIRPKLALPGMLCKQSSAKKNIITAWIDTRVSIRKTFAQILRNETQNFSFFAHQFCAKKQQFAQSFREKLPYSAFAKLKFCAIPQLEFCAIPQFRKTQTNGDGVCFLEFNSGKILFWNVFL